MAEQMMLLFERCGFGNRSNELISSGMLYKCV